MQVIGITGNIGRNATTQSLSNGRVAINFSICSNRYYKDSEGERKSKPTWFECTIYTKKDTVSEYLVAGKKLHVSGYFDNAIREIQEEGNSEPTKVQLLRLNVEDFELLGEKKEE